jgi:hypothetical protein
LDKPTYVYPLADALTRRAVSYWLDEAQISPGASIIEAIESGLVNARYVLVLITERFLERKWPEQELRAALTRELRSGASKVIPILAVENDRYFDRYPLLSDARHIDWERGVEIIADEVATLFMRDPGLEWNHFHPEEYIGPVWIRVLHQATNLRRSHRLTLRWGRFYRNLDFTPLSDQPRSYVHHRLEDDGIPLLASIDPPCVVTFGTGRPPDTPATNIDEGWWRSRGESGSELRI